MKAVIEAAFPICSVNGCVEEPRSYPVYIRDPNPGKCIIVANAATAHFTAKNPAGKDITFIAIDQCIWDHTSGHRKCDFAITDASIFYFVEIKDTSNTTSKHKNKAVTQLEESIKRFQAAINFAGMACKAIISFRWIPTKPAVSTSIQIAKVRFWNNYSVDLLEGNEISF